MYNKEISLNMNSNMNMNMNKKDFSFFFNKEKYSNNWRIKHNDKYEDKYDDKCEDNENLDKSAGFLIYNEDYTKVLLVRSTISNKFGPPKGHAKASDVNSFETACREVKEEIGITITAERKYESIKYKKTVFYVISISEDKEYYINDVSEINDLKWFKVSDIIFAINNKNIDSEIFIAPIKFFVKRNMFIQK